LVKGYRGKTGNLKCSNCKASILVGTLGLNTLNVSTKFFLEEIFYLRILPPRVYKILLYKGEKLGNSVYATLGGPNEKISQTKEGATKGPKVIWPKYWGKR